MNSMFYPDSPLDPFPSSAISRRHVLALGAASGLSPWGHAGGRSDVVRIVMSLEPDSLDPTNTASSANAQVAHYNIFQGLTRIEQDGTVTPCLATHWEHTSDKLHWRFTLRENARFHDGRPFDAHCVVASFARAQQLGGNNKASRSLFANVSHVVAPDVRTVVVHLKRPDVNFLFRLGESPAVILHHETWQQAATQPIGTGPYRFQHWEPTKEIRLQRFDDYWGARAHIPQAVFRFIPYAQAQVQAFEKQEVDLFFNFVSEEFKRFRNNTLYQILMGSSASKGLVALNHRRPILQDVRVRRAITYAIDREKFIEKALQGHGTVIGSHFAPSEPGYIRLSSAYPYDPERARHLLQEAGITKPLPFKLSLPPTAYARQGGPLLVADLAQVGIQLNLEHLSWPQWLRGPFSGDFDLTLINHVEPLDYAIYSDPDYYFGYDSVQFRTLLRQRETARNAREEQILLAQIQRFLAQDAANIWIFNASVGTVVRKGLHGSWVNYPIFVHDVAAMRWA